MSTYNKSITFSIDISTVYRLYKYRILFLNDLDKKPVMDLNGLL